MALTCAAVERQRLCELQGTSTQASPVAQTQTSKTLVKGLPVRNPKVSSPSLPSASPLQLCLSCLSVVHLWAETRRLVEDGWVVLM
jgi:hypothetical protein